MIAPVKTRVTSPNGLLGYWPLSIPTTDFANSLALDLSANRNHGALTGLSAASRVQAPVGSALSFNGSTSAITVTYRSVYAAPALSISAWIKRSGAISAPAEWIFGKSDGGSSTTGIYFDFETSGKITFNCNSTGGANQTALLSPTVLNDGNWHHLCGTTKGASALQTFYIDGVAAVTGTTVAGWVIGIGDITIGTYPIFWSKYGGAINEPRYYGRALDPGEVLTLYKSGFNYGKP